MKIEKSSYLISASVFLAILFIATGCFKKNITQQIPENVKKEQPTTIIEQEAVKTTKPADSMIKKEEPTIKETSEKKADEPVKKPLVMQTKKYVLYSPETFSQEALGPNDLILFFHAEWCPSCKTLSSDIEKNLINIPKGTTIFKVNYDKETELRKKYGVTYQHTMVRVDKSGNLIKKWSGSSTIEDTLKNGQ